MRTPATIRSAATAIVLLIAASTATAAPVLTFSQWRSTDFTQSTPATLDTWRGQTAIIVLWRIDCAPCQAELQALPDMAAAHPTIPFLLISLRDNERARARLASIKLPANIHLLTTDADEEDVLDALGDTRRLLPFSVALHRDGSLCASHNGILADDTIRGWIDACAK